MDALYLSAETGEDASLCIAPLSKRKVLACGHNPQTSAGYFLYEQKHGDPDGVEILARIESEEAAIRIAGLLRLT
ncbi:hypothetical protein P7D22_20310 [Lichenihabitans sp. Uapishka_5]|uniref:hypothetical protein n=1 Tax=Lichenihabitans sp. Uapishka_5 TaxID=3037302 RepID=UPI0029E800F0|nr:hypothetical protein [Lichenihabitans sp. Uapishka_5]MDX7953512.1 hypothetical protein [Lichenihabitans sp. Uapishka_5]